MKMNRIVLVVILGLLAGLLLLRGIYSSVRLATAPLYMQLNQIEANQKSILNKLNGSNNSDVAKQLSDIANQLKVVQGKLAGLPAFAPPQPQEDFNKVYTIDVGASPIDGKKDAPITIVDFADLQCPFCARFYQPLQEVLKAYPDKVKVVLKNFPLSFHPNARPAAKLAFAANEQGKYYEMIELLLQNGANVSENKVKEYAKALNLDYSKLISDMKSKDVDYEKRITDDSNLGQQVDVQGTPTFFINGKKTNARDFNGYKAEIDKILAGQ